MTLDRKSKLAVLSLLGVYLMAVSPARGAAARGVSASVEPAFLRGCINLLSSQAATPRPGCKEAAPIARLGEYHGFFPKIVVLATRPFERRAASATNEQTGVRVCPLGVGGKFELFAKESVEPAAILHAAFVAGINQWRDVDPTFGQGAQGFGKRIGVAYADLFINNFFQDFFYSSLLQMDPRYHRAANGSGGARLLRALGWTFVSRTDGGRPMFNFPQWLGRASGVSISNLYHPGNERGFGQTAKLTAILIAIDAGGNLVREFLPGLFRKLGLAPLRPDR
jgi:hypothetical protein